MPVVKEKETDPVYGDLVVESSEVSKSSKSGFGFVLATLVFAGLFAFSTYCYVQEHEKYLGGMSMQAARRFRDYHEATGSWPVGSDVFDVPSEPDLITFCLENEVRFTSNTQDPALVEIIVTYRGLGGYRQIILTSSKNIKTVTGAGGAKIQIHTEPHQYLPD